MKAIEYIRMYIAHPDTQQEAEIARLFILEMNNLVLKRNATYNRAVLAIVKEQNNKWNMLMKQTGITNTFQFVVKMFMERFYHSLSEDPDVFKELGWNE